MSPHGTTLALLDGGVLLRLVVRRWQKANPRLKWDAVFADWLGVSKQAVRNYYSGRGNVGIVGWSRVYTETHDERIPAFIFARFPRHDVELEELVRPGEVIVDPRSVPARGGSRQHATVMD